MSIILNDYRMPSDYRVEDEQIRNLRAYFTDEQWEALERWERGEDESP